MFVFGRSGKTFANTSLQIFYLLSIVYFAAYVVYNAQRSYLKYKNESEEIVIAMIGISFVCPLLMILIWIILMPDALSRFAVITHVRYI